MGNNLDFAYPGASNPVSSPVSSPSTNSNSSASQTSAVGDIQAQATIPAPVQALAPAPAISPVKASDQASAAASIPVTYQTPTVSALSDTSKQLSDSQTVLNVSPTPTQISQTTDNQANINLVGTSTSKPKTIDSDVSKIMESASQKIMINNLSDGLSGIMNPEKINKGPNQDNGTINDLDSTNNTRIDSADFSQDTMTENNAVPTTQNEPVSQKVSLGATTTENVSQTSGVIPNTTSNVSQTSQVTADMISDVSQSVPLSNVAVNYISQSSNASGGSTTSASYNSTLINSPTTDLSLNTTVVNSTSVGVGVGDDLTLLVPSSGNSNDDTKIALNDSDNKKTDKDSGDGNEVGDTKVLEDKEDKKKKKKQSKLAQRLAKLRDQFFTVEEEDEIKNNDKNADLAQSETLPDKDTKQDQKQEQADNDNQSVNDLPLSSIPGMPVIEKIADEKNIDDQKPVTKPVEEYNEFTNNIQKNKLDKLGEKIMDNNINTSQTSSDAANLNASSNTVVPTLNDVSATAVSNATAGVTNSAASNVATGVAATQISQSDPGVQTELGDMQKAQTSQTSQELVTSQTSETTASPFDNLTAGLSTDNNMANVDVADTVPDTVANTISPSLSAGITDLASDNQTAQIAPDATINSANATITTTPDAISSQDANANSGLTVNSTTNIPIKDGAGNNTNIPLGSNNGYQENRPVKSNKHYIYSIEQLLAMVIERNASDLHINVGYPAMIRLDGSLVPVSDEIITEENVAELVLPVLSEDKRDRLEVNREIDLAYAYKDMGRFRINAYFQQQTMAAAFRLIPSKIRTIDELGLPPIFHQLTKLSQGLVLVTGPTGHGKSTTLASIIQEVNLTRQCHILTIEDPIEYVFPPSKALISQREVQDDTHSWQIALKSALREDPNVILVGEMRDYETISSAITLAETGHLVFATLHTNSASQTVDRIIDVFPENQQSQIRAQLANVVETIIGQRLIPLDKGGRKAVCEIMIANPAVRNLIREGKTHQLDNVISTSSDIGMISLESALVSLVRENLITMEKAMAYSVHPEEISRLLKG